MKETQNSHYVARHLTKPWEFGQRKFWVYDFVDDAFSIESSRSFLTTKMPWGDDIEKFLNRYLETPLADFLNNRFNAETRPGEIRPATLRAIKLAVLLQRHRSSDNTSLLAELVKGGETELDVLMVGAEEAYTFVHVPMKKSCICFPEDGFVVIPFLQGRPGLGMPLHPSHMTVAVPNPAERFINQLNKYQQAGETIAHLSVGTSCRRLIVPGSARGNDESKLRGWLKQARVRAQYIHCNLAEETRRRKEAASMLDGWSQTRNQNPPRS